MPSPLPPDRLIDDQRPWRAAVLVVLGGLLTLAVSLGMRRSGVVAMGTGDAGTVVGGLSVMLGLLMLGRPDATWLLGALAVLVGVVSFPMSLGGLVVGSLLTVVGGAIGAAWSPAPEQAEFVVEPAHPVRRLLAASVDASLLVMLGLVGGAGALRDLVGTWVGYALVLAALWAVLVVPVTLWLGTTAGKWLLGLRVADDDQGRWRPVVVREAVRFGALALSAVVVVWPLASGAGLLGAGLAGLAVAGLWAGVLWQGLEPHDRLAGTRVARHRIVDPTA